MQLASKTLLVLAAAPHASGSAVDEDSAVAANPIRKVVKMLQNMQAKVEAEGEKEEALFSKYMCYCKSAGGALTQSIAAAEDKVPQVDSAIEAGEAEKKQLDADLKQHQTDRSAAKSAVADATALRKKAQAAFAKTKSDLDTNLAALKKATAAIEGGMSGSFLQTKTAQTLRNLLLTGSATDSMLDADRRDMLAFLSGEQTTGYSPASGEITGILKEMSDTMTKTLADAVATEDADVKSFSELMNAKKKEIGALTSSIETKTVRVGELAVELVQMKDDLSATQEALLDDKKFLKDMDANCATKEKEWAEVCKTRADEVMAIAETIKILNDDDALELFKKTLPGAASASFVQFRVQGAQVRAHALNIIQRARGKARDVQLGLIAMALRGKKVGFEKVITMIDEMVVLLKKEQVDDDGKKEYCTLQFDSLDDKRKALDQSIRDRETAIAEAKDSVAKLTEEIKALAEGIKDLDKSVAEATEQRKEENEDYTELMASNNAAKDLMGFAKNRLNKFYNPSQYVPPPKRELSEEDRIVVNNGGTVAPTPAPGGIAGTGVTVFAEISAHAHMADEDDVAPPPPPEAVPAYEKKSEESNGVIAMIDMLIADLDKEMQEAEVNEKNSQEEYQGMTADAAAKRTADTKAIAEKESSKAQLNAALEKHGEKKTSETKELLATLEVIQALHGECDWLLQNFDVRKAARAGEIDSLTKAKSVLSGADFSFVQKKIALRGAN